MQRLVKACAGCDGSEAGSARPVCHQVWVVYLAVCVWSVSCLFLEYSCLSCSVGGKDLVWHVDVRRPDRKKRRFLRLFCFWRLRKPEWRTIDLT